MSEKINEQTEKMREMAQTTLYKAKDAVSRYMAENCVRRPTLVCELLTRPQRI